MKKFLGVLAIAMFMFVSFAEAALVGRVDIQKILVTVKEGVSVRGKLKETFDKKQTELKKDEDEIRKSQEDFQKQSLVMNAQAKEKKEKEIQEKIMKLQQKTMEYQQEIQNMEQKFKKPILERLQALVTEISKKEGVEFTYEVSTSPIVYAKEEKDITDAVIKLYDSKYPVK